MNILVIKEVNNELAKIRNAVGKKTAYEKQHILFLKKLLENSVTHYNMIIQNLS